MRFEMVIGIQNEILDGQSSCLFSNEPFQKIPVMTIEDFVLHSDDQIESHLLGNGLYTHMCMCVCQECLSDKLLSDRVLFFCYSHSLKNKLNRKNKWNFKIMACCHLRNSWQIVSCSSAILVGWTIIWKGNTNEWKKSILWLHKFLTDCVLFFSETTKRSVALTYVWKTRNEGPIIIRNTQVHGVGGDLSLSNKPGCNIFSIMFYFVDMNRHYATQAQKHLHGWWAVIAWQQEVLLQWVLRDSSVVAWDGNRRVIMIVEMQVWVTNYICGYDRSHGLYLYVKYAWSWSWKRRYESRTIYVDVIWVTNCNSMSNTHHQPYALSTICGFATWVRPALSPRNSYLSKNHSSNCRTPSVIAISIETSPRKGSCKKVRFCPICLRRAKLVIHTVHTYIHAYRHVHTHMHSYLPTHLPTYVHVPTYTDRYMVYTNTK